MMAGLLQVAAGGPEQAAPAQQEQQQSTAKQIVMLAGQALYGQAQESVARFMADGKIDAEEAAALASESLDAAMRQVQEQQIQIELQDVASALPMIVLLVAELAAHLGGIKPSDTGKLARHVLPMATVHFRDTYLTAQGA